METMNLDDFENHLKWMAEKNGGVTLSEIEEVCKPVQARRLLNQLLYAGIMVRHLGDFYTFGMSVRQARSNVNPMDADSIGNLPQNCHARTIRMFARISGLEK